MVDPSLAQLSRLIRSKNGPTSLGAVKDVLDRAGLKPGDKIELTGADGLPIQQQIAVVFIEAEKAIAANSNGINTKFGSQDSDLTLETSDDTIEE
jgi:hypothetical protein